MPRQVSSLLNVSTFAGRTTVRDSLPSYGSHRPAGGSAIGAPMDEQLRLSSRNSPDPQIAAAFVPLELLVFATSPPHQSRFEAIEDFEQCRFVEVSIVVQPSSQYRVVSGRQLTDAGRGLSRQLPTLDRAHHLLGRFQASPQAENCQTASHSDSSLLAA